MPKHTIELQEEEVRIINVVKSVMDLASIDKTISFIVRDYADTKAYSEFIKRMRGDIKKYRKKKPRKKENE